MGDSYGNFNTGSGTFNNNAPQAFGPDATVNMGDTTEIKEAGTVVQQPKGAVHTGDGDQNNTPQ